MTLPNAPLQYFTWWFVMSSIVAVVAHEKGRNVFLWWLFGIALLPVALPLILLAKKLRGPTERVEAVAALFDDDNTCFSCGQRVELEARRCPLRGGHTMPSLGDP